jgi:hypothetical protein
MNIPVAGVAHQAGTCRFGNDPATSVLDVNCKAHELDNLYVVDTSFFPSIGAVNPRSPPWPTPSASVSIWPAACRDSCRARLPHPQRVRRPPAWRGIVGVRAGEERSCLD